MTGKALAAALGIVCFSGLARAQAPVGSASAAPSVAPPPPTEVAPPAAEAPPEVAPPPAAAAPAAPPDVDEPAPGARVKWKSNETPPTAEEEAPSEEDTDESQAVVPADAWQLAGGHFILSFERMTTLLSWKQSVQVPSSFNGSSGGSTTEVSSSGADVSLLWGGGERTPSSLPRIAFDGVFSNGFTLGGSLGLVSSTGTSKDSTGETPLSDHSGYLFGFRAGVILPATESIGIWLRGGFTHFSATTSASSSSTNAAKEVITAWDFTLDPQLVLVVAPRVGITFGPLFDIPVAGTDRVETGNQVLEADFKNSAYGVTAGASAIF
jgi:hypothetical protein